MDTSPSVLAHAGRLGDTCRRVQAQVRTPPSDQLHEMQLDADYTTIGSPALVGFRCIPLSWGMLPPLMLLACPTLKKVW